MVSFTVLVTHVWPCVEVHFSAKLRMHIYFGLMQTLKGLNRAPTAIFRLTIWLRIDSICFPFWYVTFLEYFSSTPINYCFRSLTTSCYLFLKNLKMGKSPWPSPLNSESSVTPHFFRWPWGWVSSENAFPSVEMIELPTYVKAQHSSWSYRKENRGLAAVITGIDL